MTELPRHILEEQRAGRIALNRRAGWDFADDAEMRLRRLYKNVGYIGVKPLFDDNGNAKMHVVVYDEPVAGGLIFEMVEPMDGFPSDLLTTKLMLING